MDVVFDEPGVYVAVNHDYAAIFSGAASIFVVGDPFGLNEQLGTSASSYAELIGNPSDAIPPSGMNSIDHPKQNLQKKLSFLKKLGIRFFLPHGIRLQ
jgi:nitrite reductase (NO-forming)